ncbi:hypothetical protein HER14_19615 [Acidithiobacillus thiooxidans]|uniref:hypothetical protein n=1 Tax=Acidithiobacillus thiooxidans TaxID=930 RepID=UPI001C07195F|nr:hypothetical protein [Acidithiobacillus thiooxidans]MBU2753074.1 hypothetical protein [Acidithiobacillus thiooxidans]
MEHETINITVNTFDDEGSVLAEEKTVCLSADQIADIINHAIQISILHENCMDLEKEEAIEELGEALHASDILDVN